jgi:uncharacterized protein YcgL (UPF0745 family)
VNITLLYQYIDMKIDFFEVDRVIEDLAKNYAAPCTTTWFKITNNKKPTHEEYREKVVEFMKQFEGTLSDQLPPSEQSTLCLDFVKKQLQAQILLIRRGNNKEVERRYQYYVNYN